MKIDGNNKLFIHTTEKLEFAISIMDFDFAEKQVAIYQIQMHDEN